VEELADMTMRVQTLQMQAAVCKIHKENKNIKLQFISGISCRNFKDHYSIIQWISEQRKNNVQIWWL